jgi:glutathione peroxidase
LLLALAASSATAGLALQPKTALNARAFEVAAMAEGQPDHSKSGKDKKDADAAKASDATTAAQKNAYDYSLPGPDGKDVPLSRFKGKYILVVNLGRKSSYNDQLPALIKLNDTCKDKGLVVIGVPSDDFGAAEPGTDAEIQKAYAGAKVDFPIMSVSKISGEEELPFYAYLTKGSGAAAGGPVHWNYTKFIIDKKGNVLVRLSPDVAPDSPEMLSIIDQILDGRYKPKKASERTAAAAGNAADDDSNDD